MKIVTHTSDFIRAHRFEKYRILTSEGAFRQRVYLGRVYNQNEPRNYSIKQTRPSKVPEL